MGEPTAWQVCGRSFEIKVSVRSRSRNGESPVEAPEGQPNRYDRHVPSTMVIAYAAGHATRQRAEAFVAQRFE